MKLLKRIDFIKESLDNLFDYNKLENDTGFPYVFFYISSNPKNILVDFENEDHISLIKLLIEQAKKIESKGELDQSDIKKGKYLFKKILGENISYSKYNGADCTFRLSIKPTITEYGDGKTMWLRDNKKMEKYI